MTDFNHLFAACFNKGFEHVTSQVKTRVGKMGDNSEKVCYIMCLEFFYETQNLTSP